jgi:hypothetical protein
MPVLGHKNFSLAIIATFAFRTALIDLNAGIALALPLLHPLP